MARVQARGLCRALWVPELMVRFRVADANIRSTPRPRGTRSTNERLTLAMQMLLQSPADEVPAPYGMPSYSVYPAGLFRAVRRAFLRVEGSRTDVVAPCIRFNHSVSVEWLRAQRMVSESATCILCYQYPIDVCPSPLPLHSSSSPQPFLPATPNSAQIHNITLNTRTTPFRNDSPT